MCWSLLFVFLSAYFMAIRSRNKLVIGGFAVFPLVMFFLSLLIKKISFGFCFSYYGQCFDQFLEDVALLFGKFVITKIKFVFCVSLGNWENYLYSCAENYKNEFLLELLFSIFLWGILGYIIAGWLVMGKNSK